MRTQYPIPILLLFLVSITSADRAPRIVNLLTTIPTTVAVSSTVANANHLPEHLVDGNLTTAWNSKTGELGGAWVRVRLPSVVQVKTIKLTAGFIHKNPAGDFFTMNPRIKKVRISRAGQPLVEHTLDVESRRLQEISVDQPGGDFEIRVLEIIPGSKPHWREICVSELEVWGTLDATIKAAKSTPSVRIGSLDAAPTLTREQCIRALFPYGRGDHTGPDQSDDLITGVEVLPFNDNVVICRVDHASKGASSTMVELGAVKRSKEPLHLGLSAIESMTIKREHEGDRNEKGTIELAPFPLTRSETGLLVHVTRSRGGPVEHSEKESKLYRLSASGLAAVLIFQSEWSASEGREHADSCTLKTVTPAESVPPRLIVECVEENRTWHEDDSLPRPLEKKVRQERYDWKGGMYEKQ